ncbi:hypothetical protein IWW36_003691 [Coemansia brasiliensis]|uniref:RNA polymerase II assembly factor Rtp1 C-terminal domain-containing protein n=1 Tax=Coemansia brasiliensis TaxID=2650707 RepID=A0A9W8LYQ4_9FUNG|nr:hypothetical protein IWW36_003691 [Coemansia brasiliensis]
MWKPSPSVTISQLITRLVSIIDKQSQVSGEGDVASLVITKFHADLLACLLVLAYSPLPPKDKADLLPPYVESDPEHRIWLRRAFTRIFDASNPYLLLESLTTLLNAASTSPANTKMTNQTENQAKGRRRAPRWFITLCSRFLTRVICKYPNDGMRIALDFLVGQDDSPSTEKTDRISSLILTPPAQMDPQSYWDSVIPQLRNLINSAHQEQQPSFTARPEVHERIVQTSIYALRQLADSHSDVFDSLVAQPLINPLLKWRTTCPLPPAINEQTKAPDQSQSITSSLLNISETSIPPRITELNAKELDHVAADKVIATWDDLFAILEQLQQLVLTGIPSVKLVSMLVAPAFLPLFHWFSFEQQQEKPAGSSNNLATTADVLRDILITSLRILPTPAATALIIELVQHTRDENLDWPEFISIGKQQTGLAWRSACLPDSNKNLQDNSQSMVSVSALMDILGSTKLLSLCGDVFLTMLREQEAMVDMLENTSAGNANIVRSWWMVSQVILAIVDKFGTRVLTRHTDILAFILGILDHHGSAANADIANQHANGQDGNSNKDTPSLEDLIQSLGISENRGSSFVGEDLDEQFDMLERKVGGLEMVVLSLMLLGQILDASEQAAFAGSHERAEIRDMPTIEWNSQSLQLLRRIQDSVKQLNTKAVPMVSQLCAVSRHQIALILALNSTQSQEATDSNLATKSEQERFSAAIRDIRDDLVPVKAHGMIELRNMVLAKSTVFENPDQLETVISLFVELTHDSDSFLYLNAIRGLAALADTHGSKFIPQLVAMYGSNEPIDQRLRIGEALLQCVQRAGMMLGEYAQSIVPQLLNIITRHENDAVVVHSAISILAACARACSVAMHRWLDEIALTLDNLLVLMANSEDEQEMAVRRASVVFWVDLVTGYESRLLQMADGQVLKAIYKTLRQLAHSDSDELVRIHAQTGIDQIDSTIREQLIPSNYLP